MSSEKAEDAATVTVSAAPLCISGIRDSALQLGVQQLPLNPGSQRFLSQITRQSLSTSSQPPLPNGSVTKMTMENNLLTIETEERNVSVGAGPMLQHSLVVLNANQSSLHPHFLVLMFIFPGCYYCDQWRCCYICYICENL